MAAQVAKGEPTHVPTTHWPALKPWQRVLLGAATRHCPEVMLQVLVTQFEPNGAQTEALVANPQTPLMHVAERQIPKDGHVLLLVQG